MPIVSGSFAGTKTVNDAITWAQNEFKGIVIATTDAINFANEIYQIIGTATNWQWLIVQGTPFGTVQNQIDYAKVPTDINRLRAAWIWDDSSIFTPILPMTIFEYQMPTNIKSIPRSISIQDNTNFRLYPTPNQSRPGVDANPGTWSSGVTAPGGAGQAGQWLVVFEYYKRPVTIASTAATFEFPDQFFPNFMAGFVARVAQFLDDDRAGEWGGRNEKGQFMGTGLWGKFANMLNEEVRVENLRSGQSIHAPWEPIYMDQP